MDKKLEVCEFDKAQFVNVESAKAPEFVYF